MAVEDYIASTKLPGSLYCLPEHPLALHVVSEDLCATKRSLTKDLDVVGQFPKP